MKYLLILITTISLYAHSVDYYVKLINKTTVEQQEVAKFIAYNGKKYNLKYTLLAIGFKESQWGRFKLNLKDPSAGLFHKLLPYYCVELGLVPNKWNQSRVAERLIENNAEAIIVAINDLKRNFLYFKTKGYNNKVSWRYMIQAYNAGISNYKAGKRYYKEIVKIIRALRILNY